MKKRVVVLVLTAFAALALLVSCSSSNSSGSAKSTSQAQPPAPQVTVAVAQQESVPLNVTAIGNAQPYRTVQLKSMVDGQIAKVLFRQGDDVRAGQLLFVLDRRPFEAALAQAQGKLAQDKATAAYNQAEAARDNALAQSGVIAPQVLQQQQALAESNQAAVQSDQAAIQTAKVNLSYTDIRAPIDARAGAILVNVGNLVKANDTNALVTLNEITPIYVQFNIPEAQLDAVRASGGVGHLRVEAASPGATTPSTGTLTFIDNAVDPTTGTIKLMGTFPNRNRQLWPGQFLNVTLRLGIKQNATVIPATAVQAGQNGSYVYVVQPNGTAVVRNVTSNRTYRQLAVIDKGVKPGERVIVNGQIKVVPNAKVDVVQTVPVQPAAEEVAQETGGQP